MTVTFYLRRSMSGMQLLLAGVLCMRVAAEFPRTDTHPISRIARIFNPQLVEVEEKIDVFERELAVFSERCDHPLKVALGYRGCRLVAGGEDPRITLDVGVEYAIDTITLVPTQREFLEDSGIFPQRFTLETSDSADFGSRQLVFTTGRTLYLPPDGAPVTFHSKQRARYVRLTVQEGHNKGARDLYGLSEIVVTSNGEPVSFGASVKTVGDFDAPGIWQAAALTDGRMPLGIWQTAVKARINPGDAVTVADPQETTTWTIQLPAAAPLDRVVLFPYQVEHSAEASVLPESLAVSVGSDEAAGGGAPIEWNNPMPGSGHLTPLVIPLHGQAAQTVRVTARRPAMVGGRNLHALSEIEVWSHGKNLAMGLPVRREHAGETSSVAALTDGCTSDKKILSVPVWLHQLEERSRIERELVPLRSIQRDLSTNSELNTTWACSMLLGMTILIPVFFIERRRLITKDHLDQIRKRISADLHDDIGSNLGSISLIARTARKDLLRLQGPAEIAADLEEVEAIARESSLAMRDIVWLLERQQDSIGDLVQRMRETASRLLREMDFTLDCDSTRTATKLSLNVKRHLFLFFKESIHNILKHSQASQVSIRLWDENDMLALEISDNGVGIPMTVEARPAAVNKLEDRSRVIGGRLAITSSKEHGTRIQLLVKRAHLSTRAIHP